MSRKNTGFTEAIITLAGLCLVGLISQSCNSANFGESSGKKSSNAKVDTGDANKISQDDKGSYKSEDSGDDPDSDKALDSGSDSDADSANKNPDGESAAGTDDKVFCSKNIAVAMVVDVSVSMNKVKSDGAKVAVRSFVDSMKANDQLGLVTFSGSASLVLDMSVDLNQVKTATDTIGQNRSAIGTDIASGLTIGSQMLGNYQGKNLKLLILITDGEDLSVGGILGGGEGGGDIGRLSTDLKASGVRIIGVAVDSSQRGLANLSSIVSSPQDLLPVGDSASYADVLKDISEKLCRK